MPTVRLKVCIAVGQRLNDVDTFNATAGPFAAAVGIHGDHCRRTPEPAAQSGGDDPDRADMPTFLPYRNGRTIVVRWYLYQCLLQNFLLDPSTFLICTVEAVGVRNGVTARLGHKQ
jgi:hypothetical protein